MMMTPGATSGSGYATGEEREAERGTDDGQQADEVCFHGERSAKFSLEMAASGRRPRSAGLGIACEPLGLRPRWWGWNQTLGGSLSLVGGLSTSGVPPFDFVHQFVEQALRPVSLRKAFAGTLEHLKAHRAAKREAPAFVIEMREVPGAFGRFAADDAGLITGGDIGHVAGWGSGWADGAGGGSTSAGRTPPSSGPVVVARRRRSGCCGDCGGGSLVCCRAFAGTSFSVGPVCGAALAVAGVTEDHGRDVGPVRPRERQR